MIENATFEKVGVLYKKLDAPSRDLGDLPRAMVEQLGAPYCETEIRRYFPAKELAHDQATSCEFTRPHTSSHDMSIFASQPSTDILDPMISHAAYTQVNLHHITI
jgi:hypothetical protein